MMKIKELCKKVRYEEVFESLRSIYQVPLANKINYYQIFRKLRNAKNVDQAVITVHVDVDIDYDDMYDTYGTNTLSDDKLILHFSPFIDWANFFGVNHDFTNEDFLAHILFEIGYISFDEEEIEKEYFRQFKEKGWWKKCRK